MPVSGFLENGVPKDLSGLFRENQKKLYNQNLECNLIRYQWYGREVDNVYYLRSIYANLSTWYIDKTMEVKVPGTSIKQWILYLHGVVRHWRHHWHTRHTWHTSHACHARLIHIALVALIPPGVVEVSALSTVPIPRSPAQAGRKLLRLDTTTNIFGAFLNLKYFYFKGIYMGRGVSSWNNLTIPFKFYQF